MKMMSYFSFLIATICLIGCSTNINSTGINSSFSLDSSNVESASEEEKQIGTFYDLAEMYNQGVISELELKSICYYNNKGLYYTKDDDGYHSIKWEADDIIPLEPLDEETQRIIENDYCLYLLQQDWVKEYKHEVNKERVEVGVYSGKYGDYYSLWIHDFFEHSASIEFDKVGDYYFFYPTLSNPHVMLWKPNALS